MDSSTSRTEDVRVRNVACHRGDKKDHGTLTLRRHHLVFTYVPTPPDQHGSGLSTPRASRESSDAGAPAKTPGAKRKLKDMWLPYPLINHCVLRPGHQHTRPQQSDEHRDHGDHGDSSRFPPVYGTSTHPRPSTDSSMQASHGSPRRSSSPVSINSAPQIITGTGQDPGIRIRTRDFRLMAFTFYGDAVKSSDAAAREVFYCLRHRCCVDRVQDLHAFYFKAPQEETSISGTAYDARREFARMGIGAKAAEGVGSAWRISTINEDYTFSPTYPSILCVPATVSDNMLKYGGPYRSKSRIPALTYLHSNGGSITRSSQPMPGLAGKRNPQDERLVSAIFSSQTPSEDASTPVSLQDTSHQPTPEESDERSARDHERGDGRILADTDLATTSSDAVENETMPRPKVYGTTRKRLIVDARPRLNALANRATGGGIEDVSNYCDSSGELPQRLFLDIANIHVMRKSLALVVESFGSADYIRAAPLSDLLQKSGWLGHIAGLIDGSEKVARAVGLGGDHVLVHCSDGWDRTSQVAAIAEVMLDPYYRTFTGFMTLIQKDFLSFGHKFNHRHGVLGCEKWFDIEHERVMPMNPRENGVAVSNLGSKALSGAKNWFEKNRNGLFKQQNDSRSSLDGSPSRPPSPPTNPILHSPATSSTAKDREHKVKEDEIAPIFHQFLDAVYQLQYSYPTAFEFNEVYLRRLLYQVYSCQYGEFLFNNEQERSAQGNLLPSVWPHFVARQGEFSNPNYAPKLHDSLLLPKRSAAGRDLEVRWWSQVFWQDDKKMNIPSNLALNIDHQSSVTPSETAALSAPSSSASAPPTLHSPLQAEGIAMQPERESTAAGLAFRPALQQRETDTNVLARYVGASTASAAPIPAGEGTRTEAAAIPVRSGLDFAAFAQNSAYSDR